MRTILLGRKRVACEALRYMKACGDEVVAVVEGSGSAHEERLGVVAASLGVQVIDEPGLYALCNHSTVDLVVSILYQRLIKKPLIDLPRIGCINFHPAPLPGYRGWGTYNVGILDGTDTWGASAHFVNECFDEGPLIAVERFDVKIAEETALSLERKTQPILFGLFQKVYDRARAGERLPRVEQGPGRYISKREFFELRRINADDSPELIERKIRAFWYPPYQGAEVRIDGTVYTLVNQRVLAQMAALLHDG